MTLDEDDENPSLMRNSREKLDLLIEYQTVSEENQGNGSGSTDCIPSFCLWAGQDCENLYKTERI